MKLSKLILFSLGFVFTFSSIAYGAMDYGQPESSTKDYTLFERDDEIESYEDHGFSRGDIKYLHETKYNPRQEKTINGEITKVMRVRFPNKDCYAIIVIRKGDRELLANVAPIWFLDENNMRLDEGGRVKIKGSFIKSNGRQVILVSEIIKNGKSLKVRDTSGNSLWGNPDSQQTDFECEETINY